MPSRGLDDAAIATELIVTDGSVVGHGAEKANTPTQRVLNTVAQTRFPVRRAHSGGVHACGCLAPLLRGLESFMILNFGA